MHVTLSARRLAAAVMAFGIMASTSAAIAADMVTAVSRFGNGSITAPVREGREGWQVRLPHGTWVYCRRSCAETLRVETVDIFENQGLTGYGTRMNECGIFGCLTLRYPR